MNKGNKSDELIIANKELAFQNEEKEKRAAELIIANKELLFQNKEKEKRADELFIANKELAFQNEEKEKRANELIIANKELAFQNKEKEKRAKELIIANKELVFQNREKEKRADELFIANKELAFQNEEKEKRAAELIIAKEKAEESDRLKSAFLANMSHEIRTPMNGILGFAELLKEPKLTGEEQQEYIGIIEKSGARMLNIINDIISISKIESGQIEISISETNVNKQIVFLYTFFKPEAELKGIQLSIKNSLPAKEAIINTDREKIYSIFTNLIKNAIKFTVAGSIEFGYEKKENCLEFFVKDTGIGIRQAQKEIIFERFRQGSESLTRNYEGAGLGLSISKAYVEMLGGKIWVESELGKGSIFYFTIPCNVESEEKNVIQDIVSDDGEENQINNLKILIAEDDETSEMLLRMAVKIFCKEILTVRTGVEAIEACRNNPDIDLVLMDVKMPEMDGYTAVRHIRQFNKDVVIIAQTAYGLAGDREKAMNAGCNGYISKPIKKDELMALIQKHFNK
jgi:signal transduction histidine kinase/ActR/RegA family two-component response regulator